MLKIDENLVREIVVAVLKALEQQGLTAGSKKSSENLSPAVPAKKAERVGFESGQVLTGEKVEKFYATFGPEELLIGQSVIITPEARDRAKDLGVRIVIE